jgi:hypothetical protein
MSELGGQGGELRAVVEIKRKATGLVEKYELIGRVTPEQEEEILDVLENMKLDSETRSFHAMTIPAQEAQLIEQLRWTVDDLAAINKPPKE